jgi:hypothetical protein
MEGDTMKVRILKVPSEWWFSWHGTYRWLYWLVDENGRKVSGMSYESRKKATLARRRFLDSLTATGKQKRTADGRTITVKKVVLVAPGSNILAAESVESSAVVYGLDSLRCV